MKRSSRSWATAPEAATIKPLTVPRTVAKAMAEMIAKSSSPKERASSGAAMLLSAGLITAVGHGAQPHEEGQDVEEANRGNRHDGGFARAGRAGYGVIADQNVRQGGGAQEQSQHQRKEVQSLQPGAFHLELQARAHDAVARNQLGIVDGDLLSQRYPQSWLSSRSGPVVSLSVRVDRNATRERLAGFGIGLAADFFEVAHLAQLIGRRSRARR